MSTGRRTRTASSHNNQLDISGTASITGGSRTSTNEQGRPANDADAQQQQSKAIKANTNKNKRQQQQEVLTIHFPASPYRAARTETFPGVPVDLFKDCGLDDPSITLDWYDKPATTFLKYILPRRGRQQQPQQQRPVWFPQVPGVAADTIHELKQSIVNYIRLIDTGAKQNFGNTMIAPLTISEENQVTHNIRDLMTCPQVIAAYGRWSADVAANQQQTPVGPICRILLNLDGKNPNLPTVANAAPVQLQGVRLFE